MSPRWGLVYSLLYFLLPKFQPYGLFSQHRSITSTTFGSFSKMYFLKLPLLPILLIGDILLFSPKCFTMIQNHEIDYRIFGEEMQYVEIELDPNETAIAEPGAFMMMEDGIDMQTMFGDGSNQQGNGGLLGKLLNAGKRVLAGENLFMTAYTNLGSGKKHVSFASPYPGKIIALNLQQLG